MKTCHPADGGWQVYIGSPSIWRGFNVYKMKNMNKVVQNVINKIKENYLQYNFSKEGDIVWIFQKEIYQELQKEIPQL